jgi:glycosyltransferase involved in cell wall biosynthesis
MKVAHLTTVDLSLRFLLFPQLVAVIDDGGEVIAISAPGPWVDGLERDGIRHVALPSSTRRFDLAADLRTARDLWEVLRRERPDVLHTHNPKPGLYGRIVGRLAGVPIVVNTVHGLYATEDDRWAKRALVGVLEAIASRCSDEELVQNPEDLAWMVRLHVSRRDRTRLLGNGVDLTRFDPARFTADDRAALRAELGIGSGDVLVGSVGRLVAEKGYPELFEAVAALPQRYRLVVVGADDPEKPDALDRDMVEAARARGVEFLGHRDDVDALYAAMDVFVLASHREGFPRAAMEAAAMGVPVVATDIRGCRQVVDDGVNGLLVGVGRPAALADAIRALGDDPDRLHAAGTAGRRIAIERFDERRCVQIVLDTYRAVAQRKGITWS